MKPRKVVIFAPWFGVNSGGAEVALLKIGEALGALGHDVSFYTTLSLRPYADWLENPPEKPDETFDGFPVHRFRVDQAGMDRYQAANLKVATGTVPTARQQDDFFRYGMTSTALVKALEALDDDVLIIGGPYYQALVHEAVRALPGRIFIMPAFHDEAPFHFPAITRLVRDARGIFFLTESEKLLLTNSHGSGLDRGKFETPVLGLPYVEDTRKASGERGLVQMVLDRYFLYVGRLDAGKNIFQLIKWHHEANERRKALGRPTIPLLLAGKGADLDLSSPYVTALGYVSEEQKRQLIEGALGLVNLSRNESFSFVLFEAWQLGVPVIVHSDCAVMREHIDKGLGGFSCRTAAEYESALREFENPELHAKLSRNGQAYADKICSMGDFRERLVQIIEANP